MKTLSLIYKSQLLRIIMWYQLFARHLSVVCLSYYKLWHLGARIITGARTNSLFLSQLESSCNSGFCVLGDFVVLIHFCVFEGRRGIQLEKGCLESPVLQKLRRNLRELTTLGKFIVVIQPETKMHKKGKRFIPLILTSCKCVSLHVFAS